MFLNISKTEAPPPKSKGDSHQESKGLTQTERDSFAQAKREQGGFPNIEMGTPKQQGGFSTKEKRIPPNRKGVSSKEKEGFITRCMGIPTERGGDSPREKGCPTHTEKVFFQRDREREREREREGCKEKGVSPNRKGGLHNRERGLAQTESGTPQERVIPLTKKEGFA